MTNDNDFDRFELEVMREQYEAEHQDEDGLPEHKKRGYAERIEEMADMLRDEMKERGFK